MRIIDAHVHLTMPEFASDLPEVLERAAAAGVEMMVCVGTDLGSSRQCVELARRFPGRLYAAVGIHPNDAAQAGPGDMLAIRTLCLLAQVVAVGETGLDFHHAFTRRDLQLCTFRKHIRLARETGKPLILHARRSDDEVLAILAEEAAVASPGGPALRGVRHCFDASPEIAARYIQQGFCVSFGGILTQAGFKKAKAAAAATPADRLLIETDCPYQTPAGRVGQRNEPAFIVETVHALAALRGETAEEVARTTTANALRLFFLNGQKPPA
jgi:TatD DNase family protein